MRKRGSLENCDMTIEQVKQKIMEYKWEVWMYRPYGFLVVYPMMKACSRVEFLKEGIDGEFPAAVFDSYFWYSNHELSKKAGEIAGEYLKKKDIFTLTRQCEERHKFAKREINRLLADEKTDPLVLFAKIMELVRPMNVYVFVAHAAEEYYVPILKEAARKYVSAEEIDKFIGDISFPSKKNVHVMLEDDIRAGLPIEELHKRYGWMKARTSAGFGIGYTLDEMVTLKQEILSKKPEERFVVSIPGGLRQLVSEVQELVYLRTYRSDALYDVYFAAQPIFLRVAKLLGVSRLDYCLPDEILAGKAREYPLSTAILQYGDDVVVCDSIFKPTSEDKKECSGQVAWGGKVRGIVKIVQRIEELGKVNEGDVLVTNMTIPAYISAMKKAVAFVTNEGGITCHAAIIAREMKKPCIIGTKVATQIFKDGDMVEVDAEKGIVRKI